MKHALSFFVLSSVALFAQVASAEEPHEAEPRAEVTLDTVIGLTGEKREGADVDSLTRSMLLEGKFCTSPDLQIGVYLPYTSASVRIDGVTNGRSSLGNVGAGIARRFTFPSDVTLKLGAVVTLPTASGDPYSADADKRDKAGLGEFSNRIRMFEEDEFFTVRRWSLVPRIDVSTLSRGGWAFSAYGKLPLLFRAGGEDLPDFASAQINKVGFEGIVGGQILRQFGEFERVDGTAAAVGARIFLVEVFKENIEEPALPADDKTQVGFEFVGKFRFGPVLANLGVLLPVTGRANEAYPKQHAFRLGVGAQF